MRTRLAVFAVIPLLFLFLMGRGAFAQASVMNNELFWTGEGAPNPFYGRQVKNIMFFHAGGWSGLPGEHNYALAWPLSPPAPIGGAVGYLSKDPSSYLVQMELIKELGDIAIAQLIMPDEEANASGYGACFGGIWIVDRNCAGGAWTSPKLLFPVVQWAAWMKGIESAPQFSINMFDKWGDQNRAKFVVERLRKFVDWYIPLVGIASLHTSDGRIVILTEGIPEFTNLCADTSANAELLAYMNSRNDIFWLDNLSCPDPFAFPPSMTGANVIRTAAVMDPAGKIQEWLKSIWGDRFRWTFLDRYGRKPNELAWIPEDVRLRWLNIAPHDSEMYPVLISQWNEYGEYLAFEPNTIDVWREYDYLQWRLSQQP